MPKSLRIVFMGTPEFAVPSLQALINSKHQLVGVITAPDRKAGRGRKLKASPIKELALNHDIAVLQPGNLKAEEFQRAYQALSPDLNVVVAFRMLPQSVWDFPEWGTMNLHASLLPDYRGAAPINWAIINGEKKTGLTTFLLKHEIDTGDLLLQEEIEIGEMMTAGELHDKMMDKGASLLQESVNLLAEGKAEPKPQKSTGQIKKAPKIFREDCRVDFGKTDKEDAHNMIRGLSPFPGAWCKLENKFLKLKLSRPVSENLKLEQNTLNEKEGRLFIGLKDGALEILELQLEGKKQMDAQSFLNGTQMNFPQILN